MATYWSHFTVPLFGNNGVDSYNQETLLPVPGGSTLLRTIVDVAIGQLIVFGSSVFHDPFAPVSWYVGDVNSDVGPHADSGTVADGLSGIPVLAHGQVSVDYALCPVIIAATGTISPAVPLMDQDVSLTYDSSIGMYLSGHQHVDSNAQRRFFSGNPIINASIFSSIPGSNGYGGDSSSDSLLIQFHDL